MRTRMISLLLLLVSSAVQAQSPVVEVADWSYHDLPAFARDFEGLPNEVLGYYHHATRSEREVAVYVVKAPRVAGKRSPASEAEWLENAFVPQTLAPVRKIEMNQKLGRSKTGSWSLREIQASRSGVPVHLSYLKIFGEKENTYLVLRSSDATIGEDSKLFKSLARAILAH